MGRFAGGIVPFAAATEIGGEAAGLARGTLLETETGKTIAGNIIGNYVTQFDNNLKIADGLIKDNSGEGDTKKSIVANLLTLGQAAAFTVLPVNKYLRDNFSTGVAKDALQYITDLGENGLQKSDLENFITDKVIPRLKPLVKLNAEMVALNYSNAIISNMFDETGATKNNDVLPTNGDELLRIVSALALLLTQHSATFFCYLRPDPRASKTERRSSPAPA